MKYRIPRILCKKELNTGQNEHVMAKTAINVLKNSKMCHKKFGSHLMLLLLQLGCNYTYFYEHSDQERDSIGNDTCLCSMSPNLQAMKAPASTTVNKIRKQIMELKQLGLWLTVNKLAMIITILNSMHRHIFTYIRQCSSGSMSDWPICGISNSIIGECWSCSALFQNYKGRQIIMEEIEMIVVIQICYNNIKTTGQMGAGGCLGPKKMKNQVYFQLITQMHEDAHKITSSQNLDLYQAIKDKLTKKGHLRKFIDNLSSHRNKILQSFNYNYKCTSQSKEIQRHYVGLVIADALIELVYPQHSRNLEPANIDAYEQEVELFSSHSSKNSMTKKAERSRKLIETGQTPKNRYEFLQQNKSAYDDQYFKIVWYLFQNQKKMQLRLLESLISFCYRHPGVITCESYTWKTINRLTDNINKNMFLLESCQLFNLLLIRTRDQTTEELRNKQTLISIIKLWLKQKQNIEIDGADVLSNCFQIVSIHFSRCISSWDSMFLYQVILSLYDQIQFQKIKLYLLQKMYEQILRNIDMREHFLKGLFNYLLGYLSVTHESTVEQIDKKWFATSLGLSFDKMRSQYKNVLNDCVKIEGFKLLNSWVQKGHADIDQFCMYNSKALIFVYISNAKIYCKSNRAMLELILEQYFKIINKVHRDNYKLFTERVFEQFRDEGLNKIEYSLLLRLIKQMVLRGRPNSIFDSKNYSSTHTKQFKENKSLKEQYKSLDTPSMIDIAKMHKDKSREMPMLDTLAYLKTPARSFTQTQQSSSQLLNSQLKIYLTPILIQYDQEVKLEILKLLGYIFQKVQEIKLNEEGRNKLCEFLYSIYENLLILEEETLSDKYQFVCAAISMIRIFVSKAYSNNHTHPQGIDKSHYSQSSNSKYPISPHILLGVFTQKMEKQTLQKYNETYHSQKHIQSQYLVLCLSTEIRAVITNHDTYIGSGSKFQNSISKDRKRSGILVTSPNKSHKDKHNDQHEENYVKQKQKIQRMISINCQIGSSSSLQQTKFVENSRKGRSSSLQIELLSQMSEFIKLHRQDPEQTYLKQQKNGIQNNRNKDRGQQKQQKNEQREEYKIIFARLFSSNVGDYYNNRNSMAGFNYVRRESEGSVDLSRNSSHGNTKTISSKGWRNSDKSFEEIIDIVHV